MLSHGKKGLMIIRTDYFIDAVEANDKERVEDLLKKDIEKFRLHSSHGRRVPGSHSIKCSKFGDVSTSEASHGTR
jgi:S-ribosylhomocysteine lyase LuxS involved in autoinducer biosynthesis